MSTIISFVFLFLLLSSHVAAAGRPTPAEFIKTSCTDTTYPDLCVSSLSSYASKIKTSPTELASTALLVSLAGARSTTATFTKISGRRMRPREVQAMRDCVENVESSVDELRRSVAEMSHLGGQSLGFQISNIQTWVSAALTDANTCMDGFAGRAMDGDLKRQVRVEVLRLARLTSNALSLVNKLVNK